MLSLYTRAAGIKCYIFITLYVMRLQIPLDHRIAVRIEFHYYFNNIQPTRKSFLMIVCFWLEFYIFHRFRTLAPLCSTELSYQNQYIL